MNNVKKYEIIPALKKGEFYVNAKPEKVEHFAKVCSSANYSKEFREHTNMFEKENEEVFRFRSHTNSVLNVDFQMSEFKKALIKGNKYCSMGRSNLLSNV